MFNLGKKAATVSDLFKGFADELARIRGEQFKIAEAKNQEIVRLTQEADAAVDEGNKADKLLERLNEVI